MGFNEKVAYYSGKKKPRVINLDMTYEHIIKPAVISAGYRCTRADEIMLSGVIDKKLFENLLAADVVVADISTSNANALYELGVRHALRPRATIVMAEEDFAFPFDVSHLSIFRYRHLGPDIGMGEAIRATNDLTRRLQSVVSEIETDSPVYLFLPQLTISLPARQRRESTSIPVAVAERNSNGSPARSIAEFKDAYNDIRNKGDWRNTGQLLEAWLALQPGDPFLTREFSIAIYSSRYPDALTALKRAKKVMESLTPETSTDPQTIYRWGAIHKHLWQVGGSTSDLDEAIASFERGFVLENDYSNGINYAFMLDVRATHSAGQEAIADRVFAKRVRYKVLDICESIISGKDDDSLSMSDGGLYWVRAARAEALAGVGRNMEAERALAELGSFAQNSWMEESTRRQIANLRELLQLPDTS
jgi:hypothetical protein